VPPDLVDGAGGTLEGRDEAVEGGQGGLDVGEGVGDGAGGDDAGIGEDLAGVNSLPFNSEKKIRQRNGKREAYGIRIQPLIKLYRLLEVIRHLGLAGVVSVALRVEGGNAGSMLIPLVLPERLVVAGVVFPVGVHLGEESGFAVGFEDGGDVGVFARGIAECVVGAIAAVRPGNKVSF